MKPYPFVGLNHLTVPVATARSIECSPGLIAGRSNLAYEWAIVDVLRAHNDRAVALQMSAYDAKRTCHVLRLENRLNHLSCSIARCRELIAIAVSQIDGDPVVSDRFVDPALEITVAHFKKIIALQRAGRGNPMTHKNAEDLKANVQIGRSVMHALTIGFDRHRSYVLTATVDKIAQPMVNLAFCCGSGCRMSAFGGKRTWAIALQMSAYGGALNEPRL